MVKFVDPDLVSVDFCGPDEDDFASVDFCGPDYEDDFASVDFCGPGDFFLSST